MEYYDFQDRRRRSNRFLKVKKIVSKVFRKKVFKYSFSILLDWTLKIFPTNNFVQAKRKPGKVKLLFMIFRLTLNYYH